MIEYQKNQKKGKKKYTGGTSIGVSALASVPPKKAMAPHSSTLARKIPWMEEPDGPVYGVAKSRT